MEKWDADGEKPLDNDNLLCQMDVGGFGFDVALPYANGKYPCMMVRYEHCCSEHNLILLTMKSFSG